MRQEIMAGGGISPEQYVMASCGHEVYRDEYIYDWEDGKTLCPECLDSCVNGLTQMEKAMLIGSEYRRVGERDNEKPWK